MNVIGWRSFQRLKAAVHYTVGRICQKIGEEQRREFSRQVIAAIAETAVRQCGGWQHSSVWRFEKIPHRRHSEDYFWNDRLTVVRYTTITHAALWNWSIVTSYVQIPQCRNSVKGFYLHVTKYPHQIAPNVQNDLCYSNEASLHWVLSLSQKWSFINFMQFSI